MTNKDMEVTIKYPFCEVTVICDITIGYPGEDDKVKVKAGWVTFADATEHNFQGVEIDGLNEKPSFKAEVMERYIDSLLPRE